MTYRTALLAIQHDGSLCEQVKARAMVSLQRRAMCEAEGIDDVASRFDLSLADFVAYLLPCDGVGSGGQTGGAT